MVHYIQPYSITKNIGGAINLAIESLVTSDEDWIVLLDHDVMFLRPDSKAQLEGILNSPQWDHDILSCMTNRLAKPHQLISGLFDETDILKHIEAANIIHKNYNGLVRNTNENLAAMLLCFKVRTWKILGRFSENTINFDSSFCIRAKNTKLKLGIMTGLYVFHLYRMGTEGDVRKNYQHLLNEN